MAETTAKQQRGRPFKPGQSGNPTGRPKGSKHKLTEAFWRDFADIWAKGGKDALERVQVSDPSTFVRVAASLMPKEVEVGVSENFAKLWELISNGDAAAMADRLAEEPGQSASVRH